MTGRDTRGRHGGEQRRVMVPRTDELGGDRHLDGRRQLVSSAQGIDPAGRRLGGILVAICSARLQSQFSRGRSARTVTTRNDFGSSRLTVTRRSGPRTPVLGPVRGGGAAIATSVLTLT